MRRLLLIFCLALPALGAEPVKVELESKVLGEKRMALVRLPATYERDGRRYPVLYLTDADMHLSHTSASIDFLVKNGRMPDVIVVGILHKDRTRDLTPTHVAEAPFDGELRQYPTSGGGAKFLSFVETELIPEIDKRYRTQPYRVLAGHSFGGLFTLHALVTRPKLFHAWIAISPAVRWDDGYALKRAREFAKTHPALVPSLFISFGNENQTQVAIADQLADLLGGEFSWFEDDDHSSVPMPAMYSSLRKLFRPYWYKGFSNTDDLETLWPRTQAHYASLSKHYGFEIPVPEPLANMAGYWLLNKDLTAEAFEVLTHNTRTYPESPNVWDSLGEAYERQGKLAEALEHYERAVRLSTEWRDSRLPVYEKNLERVRRDIARAAPEGGAARDRR